ncbi:MAG: hypothetical protein E7662_04045 [Ruminococcaceae bacterium]|nr:hypothetical protein [Oscillospiraceae bacterium]
MAKELYDLAQRVSEIARSDQMNEKRRIWRTQNSFQNPIPPIYLRAFAFAENFDQRVLTCTDPLLRRYEVMLHESLYRSTLGDDFIIEPWLRMDAAYRMPNGHRWGVPVALGERPKPGGAAAYKPILTEEDFSCLRASAYEVDEQKTALQKEKLEEALGGALPVFVSREGPYGMWSCDISTDLAKLRGLEQLMWDVYDNPDWLHSLLAFMRDSILEAHRQAEEAGGFSLADHQNQCMPYAMELDDPDPAVTGVPRKKLWRFLAAQEFTAFSPEMFWEFILQYQKPIMEAFGLSAYGCCENLTGVIPYLRRIKNLRRIAVSPFADVRRCAEQIGRDYILSWRPNPSSMVSQGLDEDFVRRHMREHFAIFKENHNVFDITLKDVETVSHQPENVRRWTEIVREEIVRCFG